MLLPGYTPIRADHPGNLKRDECLVCELKVGNRKCFITVLYRSPNQSLDEYERFKNGWENTILNINNSNIFRRF